MKQKLFGLATLALVCSMINVYAQDKFVITKTSVGPFSIGMDVKKLPKTMEGLYDKITRKSSYDEMADVEDVFHVASLKGTQTFVFWENESGKVCSIDVYSSLPKTAKGLTAKATANQLFSAGAKVLQDNGGAQGIWLDGVLWIGHDYTKSGQKKADDSYLTGIDQTFTAADFVSGSTGYIRINQYISEYK